MSMIRRCSSLHFTNIFIEKLEIVFGGVPILRITSAEIIQLICSLCLRRPIPLMNDSSEYHPGQAHGHCCNQWEKKYRGKELSQLVWFC